MLLRRRSARLLLLALLVTFCFPSSISAQEPDPQPSTFLPFLAQNMEITFKWGDLEPVVLEPTPRNFSPILMHLDRTGREHLLWATSYNPEFIYHTYSSAGDWTAPAAIAPTLGSSDTLYPPFEDSTGNMHLLWQNDLGTSQELPYRLMYSRFNGDFWEPEEAVYQDKGLAPRGMIHQGPEGGIRITYLDGNLISANIFQIQKTESGWTPRVEIEPSFYPSLTWPDNAGGVHFYGTGMYGDGVRYSYWQDGRFLVEKTASSGSVFGRSSQLDDKNNLHIYWQGQVPVPGGTVSGIYHQCLGHDLVWGEQEIPSGQTAISGSVQAAFDGKNQLALTWIESNPKRMVITIWEGCQRKVNTSVALPPDMNLELKALAIRQSPDKICALFRQYYTFSGEYYILCGEPE